MEVYKPSPPLSDFVDFLWLQEGPPPLHALERVVPTGTTEIVISLATSLRAGSSDGQALRRIGSAMLVGAHATPFSIDTEAQRALMGIHFRPGGAYPFFAAPASCFRDARLDLADLWSPTFVSELRDRLHEDPRPAARFAILEHALTTRMVRPLARHPAVAHVLAAVDDAPGGIRIATLRQQAGLSARRFIELFEREVGLTPKLFARIRRIQEVIRRVEDANHGGWVEPALAGGFFDQAHLIRDFRDFLDLTPTSYLARRSAMPNHIVLPGPG